MNTHSNQHNQNMSFDKIEAEAMAASPGFSIVNPFTTMCSASELFERLYPLESARLDHGKHLECSAA